MAASEAFAADKRVTIVDQEPRTNLGGQAWWSFGSCAERGGCTALGPGNSVPRFHVTWETGPGVVAPFQRLAEGRATALPRHRVTRLLRDGDTVVGAAGEVLAPSGAARGYVGARLINGDRMWHYGPAVPVVRTGDSPDATGPLVST